jgi:hypothetical protein
VGGGTKIFYNHLRNSVVVVTSLSCSCTRTLTSASTVPFFLNQACLDGFSLELCTFYGG